MFQTEQSGIEINWITGAPCAWFLSLTHIFLFTTKLGGNKLLLPTILDMVVVDISRKEERHCWDFYGMIFQPFWLLPGITNLVEISDGFRWCVVFVSSTHPDLDLHMCGRQSKLFPSSNHLGGFSFQVKNLNRGQLHERKVIKALDLFPSSVPPGWPVRWPRIRTSIEVNKPHVDFKWDHLMSIQCAPGPSFF